jgi:hypothetical protein
MRNMSFSMTTAAVRNRSKTVTRRLGWWRLEPGEVLQAVEKAQGLKRGEHVVPICLIRVVSVSEEPLDAILDRDLDEVEREGFPGQSPVEFAARFVAHNKRDGVWLNTLVNRIEFEYVEPGERRAT